MGMLCAAAGYMTIFTAGVGLGFAAKNIEPFFREKIFTHAARQSWSGALMRTRESFLALAACAARGVGSNYLGACDMLRVQVLAWRLSSGDASSSVTVEIPSPPFSAKGNALDAENPRCRPAAVLISGRWATFMRAFWALPQDLQTSETLEMICAKAGRDRVQFLAEIPSGFPAPYFSVEIDPAGDTVRYRVYWPSCCDFRGENAPRSIGLQQENKWGRADDEAPACEDAGERDRREEAQNEELLLRGARGPSRSHPKEPPICRRAGSTGSDSSVEAGGTRNRRARGSETEGRENDGEGASATPDRADGQVFSAGSDPDPARGASSPAGDDSLLDKLSALFYSQDKYRESTKERSQTDTLLERRDIGTVVSDRKENSTAEDSASPPARRADFFSRGGKNASGRTFMRAGSQTSLGEGEEHGTRGARVPTPYREDPIAPEIVLIGSCGRESILYALALISWWGETYYARAGSGLGRRDPNAEDVLNSLSVAPCLSDWNDDYERNCLPFGAQADSDWQAAARGLHAAAASAGREPTEQR